MNPKERDRLIDALIEGDISEADFLRLEAELSVDADARRAYYDRLALNELLSLEAAATQSPKRKSAVTLVTLSRRKPFLLALAAGLAFALLSGSVWWQLRQSRWNTGTPVASVEQKVSGFAVLAGQTAASWQGPTPSGRGALMPAGKLHLVTGVAQIELFSGVSVVVEGEARFEIVSSMEMVFTQGKVRARVPEPARGFRVRTVGGDVVDLGTEFALEVSSTQAEVHVLDGDVEWHPTTASMRRMAKGNAVRWEAGGATSAITASGDRFVGLEELGGRLASARQARHAEWQRDAALLRTDPRLVIHFHLTAADTLIRRVPNDAANGSALVSEGAIVAAASAGNRWGDPDGALDFSPTGSRVRVFVPGVYRSVTLLCWVKINSLDRWYNSLFLTDGHEQHEPHWQIMNDGRLFFSVKKRDRWDTSKGEKDKHIYFSPPFWSAALSGQWQMIATTYDVEARLVTHYLNGRPLSQERIPEEYLVETVHIGSASLGNWGMPERNDPNFAVRNLNGSMDEFAFFSAALTSEEIAELYRRGKP